MIKFKPYRIIVNGNDQDDVEYERWKATGADPAKKPQNLDDMELKPNPFFSEQHALSLIHI